MSTALPAHHAHWPPGVPKALPPTERSLWDCLAASAERHPDKPAVVFYDSVLSYRELARQAEALAGWLQQVANVRQGDRVLLFCQNCPQFVVATYAVLRADAVVVPVNAMWTADELSHLVEDSGAEVALVAQELRERVQPLLDRGRLRRAAVIAYADALTAPGEKPVPAWLMQPRAPLADARLTPWHEALAAGQPALPHRATPRSR